VSVKRSMRVKAKIETVIDRCLQRNFRKEKYTKKRKNIQKKGG
jgi:hypothetical protein